MAAFYICTFDCRFVYFYFTENRDIHMKNIEGLSALWDRKPVTMSLENYGKVITNNLGFKTSVNGHLKTRIFGH